MELTGNEMNWRKLRSANNEITFVVEEKFMGFLN